LGPSDGLAQTNAPRVLRRIILVHADEKMRAVLRRTFSATGWRVVGDAADGRAGLELALTERPHVVLLDLGAPTRHGIESTRAIRAMVPETDVVVITTPDDAVVFDALRAGAIGYVSKRTPTEEIAEAVEVALTGASPISKKVARLVLDAIAPNKKVGVALPPDEIGIVAMLANGETLARAAEELHVDVPLATSYLRSIYRKLALASRYAIRDT
jgi:DNA-binding NarL/FixJ family response regulator